MCCPQSGDVSAASLSPGLQTRLRLRLKTVFVVWWIAPKFGCFVLRRRLASGAFVGIVIVL